MDPFPVGPQPHLSLSDDEAASIMHRHFASLFPKTCPRCQRSYESLRDYVQSTRPLGPTIAYDAELGDWHTTNPIGALILSNCACGDTLALSSDGIPLREMSALLHWIRITSRQRNQTPRALLGSMRQRLREQIMAGRAGAAADQKS